MSNIKQKALRALLSSDFVAEYLQVANDGILQVLDKALTPDERAQGCTAVYVVVSNQNQATVIMCIMSPDNKIIRQCELPQPDGKAVKSITLVDFLLSLLKQP